MEGAEEVSGRPVIGGVPGILDSGPEDGSGGGDPDFPGDEAGLLLLELVVVMVFVIAGVVVVIMLPFPARVPTEDPTADTTKLSGDERAISSCGSGSLSIAAKLLLISCGEACRFKWTSSLSFSVKPWLQMLQW